MSWADLFERANDHGTTIERVSSSLAAIRAAHERGGEVTDESSGTDDA